jgi:prepilin-type N-terminal cleavage/methylation domain-containing protein
MRHRAYTLIEMLAVIVIVAMVAAIAVPNLAAMIKSGRRRDFLQSLTRLTVQAQQDAQSAQATTKIVTFGDNGLQIQRDGQNQSNPTVLQSLTGVEGISLSRFRLGTQEVGAADWEVKFYPDGTADAAGLEISDAGDLWHFLIDAKKGRGTLSRGELPQTQDDRWPVGDYVPRT